ncbi:hypothetical protein ES708_18358 [subsurface metagenome]
MRFFCPNYQDHPEETDNKTFLGLMLKKRPEYAIVWDVTGKDVREFHKKVWVTQYVVIKDKVVYYSQSKHYATRAQVLYNLKKIIHIESEEQWDEYLPVGEMFKPIRFYSPNITEEPEDIALEDFISKMIEIRPLYAVLWDVSLEDIEYISSRAWVVSYMPVIDDIIYYSYAKHYAFQAQKLFNIPNRKKITIQEPKMTHLAKIQT